MVKKESPGLSESTSWLPLTAGARSRNLGSHLSTLPLQPDGKSDYAQVMNYKPSPKDTGQSIRCLVEHPGYRDEKRSKEVSVSLDLYFKPQQPNSMVQTISGLKEGNQEVTITVRFDARPRPWEGFWTLSGVKSPVVLGNSSPDGNLNASHIRGAMDAGGHPNQRFCFQRIP